MISYSSIVQICSSLNAVADLILAWTPKICLECLLCCNQSQRASSSHHRHHRQRMVSQLSRNKLFSFCFTFSLFKSKQFSVFTSHVIKTKSRNHSINKFKNRGYDSWLQYKQPRQESGLCCFHSCAIRRNVSLKFIKLCMEAPCLCPSEGHKHGGRDVTKTSVAEFCYWDENFYSSRALTHWNKCFFWCKDLRDSLFLPPFQVAQRKSLEI